MALSRHSQDLVRQVYPVMAAMRLQAEFDQPVSIDLDAAGNIYFVDRGNKRVRRNDAITNVITDSSR